MDDMKQTAELAGLFTAHALWSISEGEKLKPLLGVEMPDGNRTLRKLVDGKPEEIVAAGQHWLATNPAGARSGVLVYDGIINLEEGETDAIILEAHRYEDDAKDSFGLAIPYRAPVNNEGFAVYRPKFIATRDMEPEEVQSLVDAFFMGVETHERGANVWKDNLNESDE